MARAPQKRQASPSTGARLRMKLAQAGGALALTVLACGGAAHAANPLTARADVRLPAETGGYYSVPVRSFRDIPFRTVVRQQYDYSCGSAAVATLLAFHYNMPVGESDIFSVMWQVGDRKAIARVGFSMLDMKRYLETKGFKVDGYRMTLEEIGQERVPAIALIDLGQYRHFVVIKGVRGDQVLVGDPARGLKIYSKTEFNKVWNKIVLMIHDTSIKPAFDREAEWRPWATAPTKAAFRNQAESLASLTRDLNPLYQITGIRNDPAPP
jgi:predicted double-glycine peptidase